MFHFHKRYLLSAIFLFLLELMIAFFLRDQLIRPYGGDFLVVIFLYCLLRSTVALGVIKSILLVLCFAFVVEFLQYFHFATALGMGDHIIGSVVIGKNFDWLDILSYTLGAFVVLAFEQGRKAVQKS